MFEYFNNILCVQGGWLYDSNNVMTINNYRNLQRRNILRIIRKGGNGRTALVDYESIPQRFKAIIIERFGDPYKTTKHTAFKDYLEQDAKAVEYFNNYTLDSGEALPEKNKKEYIANASVLNAINTIITNRTAKNKALGGNASRLWDKMAEIISELPVHSYPHSLPKNVRRLKEKYKAYQTEGYSILVHKGFSNKNSEKINDDAKIWVLSRWADQINKCASINQLP